MTQLFKSNWHLKLASLALAVMVYLHVRTLENRIQRTVLLPVSVTAPAGQRVVEPAVNTTVQVDLEGPAELVRTIRDEEISLQFDASNVKPGKRVRVPVSVALPEKYDRLVVTIRPQSIPVRFDADATEEFPVTLRPLNTLEGWEWRQPPAATPPRVTVTGPREAVSQVARVVAEFAVKPGERFNDLATLRVLDGRDRNITDEVRVSPVQVVVDGIQQRVVLQKRVPVQPVFQAAGGGQVVVEVVPRRVTVTGPSSALNELYVLETEPVQLPPGQSQVSEQVQLVAPPGVQVEPASVQVTLRVQGARPGGGEESNRPPPAPPAPAGAAPGAGR